MMTIFSLQRIHAIITLLCLLRATSGIPRASSEFDIYTSPSNNYGIGDNNNDGDNKVSIVINNIKDKVITISSKLGNIGGIAFLGYHAFQYIRNHIFHHNNNESDPLFPSSSSSKKLSNQLSINATTLDKIEKDYEELWGVVHGLYKSQVEKIELVEKLQKESKESMEMEIHQIQQNLNEVDKKMTHTLSTTATSTTNQLNQINQANQISNNNMKSISDRIEKLEHEWQMKESTFTSLHSQIDELTGKLSSLISKTNNQNQSSATMNTAIASSTAAIEKLEKIVMDTNNTITVTKKDISKLKEDFAKFQNTDVPTLFEQHEKLTLTKLQKFGDSIRKLVASSGSSGTNKKPSSSSSSSSKK